MGCAIPTDVLYNRDLYFSSAVCKRNQLAVIQSGDDLDKSAAKPCRFKIMRFVGACDAVYPVIAPTDSHIGDACQNHPYLVAGGVQDNGRRMSRDFAQVILC